MKQSFAQLQHLTFVDRLGPAERKVLRPVETWGAVIDVRSDAVAKCDRYFDPTQYFRASYMVALPTVGTVLAGLMTRRSPGDEWIHLMAKGFSLDMVSLRVSPMGDAQAIQSDFGFSRDEEVALEVSNQSAWDQAVAFQLVRELVTF